MTFIKTEKSFLKPPIDKVLICICTYKRPKLFCNAIKSISNIKVPNGVNVEVLVVDNDVESSAKPIYETLMNVIPFKCHYVVEAKRGISNARNCLLEESIKLNATHILLFDDDELLTSNVLVEHVKLYSENKEACIISGPTPSKFDDNCPVYIKKHFLFKQWSTKKTGLVRDNCAAGNVFFPVSVAKDCGLRFSSEYVFMGGEDGDFFSKASKLGFTIVWCNEAIIEEVVPPARTTVSYILKKCYYNGYAGTFAKFKSDNNLLKKLFYLTKLLFVLFINCLSLFPSLLLGPLGFLNVLGLLAKAFGKLIALFKNEPYNFYKNVYGE